MVQAELSTMHSDMQSQSSISHGWRRRNYFEHRHSTKTTVQPRRERTYPECIGMHSALPELTAVAKEGRECFTRHLFQDYRAGVRWTMHSSSCVTRRDTFDTAMISRPRRRTLHVIFRPYTSISEQIIPHTSHSICNS